MNAAVPGREPSRVPTRVVGLALVLLLCLGWAYGSVFATLVQALGQGPAVVAWLPDPVPGGVLALATPATPAGRVARETRLDRGRPFGRGGPDALAGRLFFAGLPRQFFADPGPGRRCGAAGRQRGLELGLARGVLPGVHDSVALPDRDCPVRALATAGNGVQHLYPADPRLPGHGGRQYYRHGEYPRRRQRGLQRPRHAHGLLRHLDRRGPGLRSAGPGPRHHLPQRRPHRRADEPGADHGDRHRAIKRWAPRPAIGSSTTTRGG